MEISGLMRSRFVVAGTLVLVLAVASCSEPAPEPAPSPKIDLEALASGPEFVGTQACVDCHAQRVEAYRGTAHHRTLREALPGDVAGHFGNNPSEMRTRNAGLRFEMSVEDGALWQTAVTTTTAGVERRRERVDLVMGSGRIFEGYMSFRDGALFQLPVGHMAQSGRWANCPGFEDGTAEFDRAIRPRCLDCHAGWIDHVEGTENEYRLEGAVLGISCERCHGPGRDHVVHHLRHPDEKDATAITHPADLTRDQRLDTCAVCHGDPGTLLAPAFSYRPGQPLEEYVALSRGGGEDGFVHTANQIQRLRASACFGDERLECTSCHDTHRDERETILASSQSACADCHTGRDDCAHREKIPSPVRGDCVACHMPKRAVVDTTFSTAGDDFVDALRMTEHRIGIQPLAARRHILAWTVASGDDDGAAARLRRDFVEELVGEARRREGEREFVAALSLWREVLEIDPQHPNALAASRSAQDAARKASDALGFARQGNGLFDAGDLAGAERAFTMALSVDGGAPEGHAGLGRVALAKGDAARALSAYTRSLAIRPGHGASRNGLGRSLAILGRFEEAAQAFSAALDLGETTARLNLARALMSMNRPREALSHLRDYVRENEGDRDARLDLASALVSLGEHDEARRIVRSLLAENSEFAPAYLVRGQLDLAAGVIDRAIESFDTAYDLEPGNVEALNLTARLLFRHGRDQEALDRLMRSLGADPTQVDVHLAAAEGFFRQGVPKTARMHVKEATRLAPDALAPRVLAIREALGELGTPRDAERALSLAENLVAVSPADGRRYEWLARAQAAVGRRDAALQSVQRGAGLARESGDGATLQRLGRLAQSLKAR